MKAVKYKEVQRFRDIGILGLLGFFFCGLVIKIFHGANDPAECLLLLAVIGTAIGVFMTIRMETVIDKKGIRYQYFPLHYKKQKISWNDVDSVEIINTPIIDELSGLNVSFAANKKYNVSSRHKGMDIKLTNGERIFIGSRKIDQIQMVLSKMGKI